MHLYSEKDVWCRWRSVTLWQVELLFLLFHQWCYITGLRVSSPFWCEKHAHAVAVLNFIHACIHTYMDGSAFVLTKSIFPHHKESRTFSSFSERLAFIFLFFKRNTCHLHRLTVNTVFYHSTREMFSFFVFCFHLFYPSRDHILLL